MAFSAGYDMTNEFRFGDGLGKLYTIFGVAWSLLLIAGIVFLVLNRGLPFLRIRNVALTISAVAVLHVYWLLCLFAYGLNGYFPCATEFWIMNIYLPLGIALFHLSNTKLLHVAVLQRKFASTESLISEDSNQNGRIHGWKEQALKLRASGTYRKAKWGIAFGLLLQLLCACWIFVTSRKFHSSYGLVGEAVVDSPTAKEECRRGWEWVLSIAWQFFWSWVYAPYLLWKVRDIRDTHKWRMQTVICCLAGMPASPMWLLALYLPPMSKVNRYFIPPLWFAPSILLIEAFMIFLPCWHIVQHRRLKKETLEIIAEWERKKNTGSSIESGSTTLPPSPQRISHKSSSLTTTSNRKTHPHMYTMAALEKALQTNSTPLLLFAALKDFSGENISFLNHVQEWNKRWNHSRLSEIRFGSSTSSDQLRYTQFVKAIEIYFSFVSLRHSNFPINISSIHLKELECTFEGFASLIHTEQAENSNSATPFDNYVVRPDDNNSDHGKDTFSVGTTAIDSTGSATDIEAKAESKQSTVVNVYRAKELGDKVPQTISVPANFGPGIFDNAAESVKYMVLTNTWPKFVDAGYAANTDRGTTMERLQDRLSECGIGRARICSY